MPKTAQLSQRRDVRISVVVLLVAFFWLNMTSAVKHMSQTYDEGFHLFAAWRYVQCGDFAINSEHPPLMKLVAATTLRLAHVPPPNGPCGAEPTTKDYGYASGIHYLFRQGLDADSVLYTARRGVSMFAIALALLSFGFARKLFGYWAGVVALTLVTFDPTVLAHGALLTTDVPLSACLLGTVFAVFCYLERPSAGKLLLCGLGLGLSLASKHSGILALPITMLLFASSWVRTSLRNGSPRARPLLKAAGAWAITVLLATAVVWAIYGFHFSGRPGNAAMTLPIGDFLAQVRSQGTRGLLPDFAIPLAVRFHLLPLPWLYGLTDVLSIMLPGQPPYILGKIYPHGVWFYFPVVFVLKNTLAFFALLTIGLVGGSWAREDRRWKLIVLMTPVVVIWAAVLNSGLNIGYRHILTTFAFLCVAAAGGCIRLVERHRGWVYPVVILLLLHAASSLRAWPDYLPYVNEAFGSKDHAYRYMTDANVDWAQGVLETRDWLAKNRITNCWYAYDGAVDMSYYHLPCGILPGNGGDFNVTALPPAQASGTFLVTSLALSGIEFEPGALNPYAAFQRVEPVANIGGSTLVYRGKFDLRPAQAVSLISESAVNLEKDPVLAAREATEALAITPSSVRARLALARAEKSMHKNGAALSDYAAAEAQAKSTGAAWYPAEIAEAQRATAEINAAH